MRKHIIIEWFLNIIDIGAVFESIRNYRKRSWEIGLGKILKYMLTGKGYASLTPPQMHLLLRDYPNGVRIIDLRETEAYNKDRIRGAVSKPIDDYLKEVFSGTDALKNTDLKTLLVCDTGQLSKVAAAIMIEEGFKQVYNLKGGMRRWNRWVAFSEKPLFKQIAACCTQSFR